MRDEAEITEKLWKSIKSDRTIMLALADDRGGDAQPMTAMFEDEPGVGPLWIFSAQTSILLRRSSKDSLAQALKPRLNLHPKATTCSLLCGVASQLPLTGP